MDTKRMAADTRVIDYFKRNLMVNNCVTDETEKSQMYDFYQHQMREKGLEPVAKNRILFLSSGMSCRDEDADSTPRDAKREADDALSFLYKIHDTEIDTVLLRVGFEREVYVANLPELSMKKPLNAGRGL